jgi:hypothetical protein
MPPHFGLVHHFSFYFTRGAACTSFSTDSLHRLAHSAFLQETNFEIETQRVSENSKESISITRNIHAGENAKRKILSFP